MRSGPALERFLQIFIELADQELCHDKNDSMISSLSGGVALWLFELRWKRPARNPPTVMDTSVPIFKGLPGRSGS